MKRILALLLSLLVLLPSVANAEAADNLFVNGDFEHYNRTGIGAYGWTVSGSNVYMIEEGAKSGENAIYLEGNGYIRQQIEGIVPGNTYTLSAYTRLEGEGVPFFYVVWQNAGGEIGNEVADFENGTYSEVWGLQKYTFTAPEGAEKGTFYLRNRKNSGDVLFDCAMLSGEIIGEKKADVPEPVRYDADVASGQQGELSLNGGFEMESKGGPAGWTNAGAPYVELSTDARNGKNAVLISSVGASARDFTVPISQKMNFVAGAKYTATFYTKEATDGLRICFKAEFGDGDDVVAYYDDLGTKKWTEHTLEFIAPKSGAHAVYIRTQKSEGRVFVDDVSITGEMYAKQIEIQKPYAGCDELLENTSFEKPNVAGNGATGWTPYGNGGNMDDWKASAAYVSWTTEKAHSGTHSVKIDNTAGKNAWIRFYIQDGIVPGADYQFSFWAYSDSQINEGIGYKYEWQTDALFGGEMPGGDKDGKGIGNTGGVWQQFAVSVQAPDIAKGLVIYARLYAPGIAFIDDVSCYRISASRAKPATLKTNNIFYETEYTGEIEATLLKSENVIQANGLSMQNATVQFAFYDGEKLLAESEVLSFAGEEVSYVFPFSLMTEKEKAYVLSATLTDDGGEIYAFAQRMFKFDRPTAINEDGLYVLDNGEILDPVFAYHVGELRNVDGAVQYLKESKAIGANVIQTTSTDNPKKVIEQLDRLEAEGLMALVSMYPSMLSAGHPDVIEKTKETVHAIKEHPALFAYAVMDEPFQQIYAGEDPAANRDEELINAYLTVRSIDSHHPVYICECQSLDAISRYCDVFLIDAYNKSYGQNTKMINTQYNFSRPVYTLMPTFVSKRDTIDTYRFQVYDAFFEGALGVGVYGMEYFYKEDMGTLLADLTEMNVSGELKQAFAHFVHNQYPLLSERIATEEAYTVYVQEGKVYTVIINRMETRREITVPLISADRKTAISDATVTGLYGASESYRATNGAVTVTLEGKRAAVYEITPDVAVDFSGLRLRSRFRDLNEITWAKDQIEKLDAKGIVNDGGNPRIYSPQKKITRADFAMFLIRTLGLTSDATETFADVPADAYYAKEMATGKALGILKGVGNDAYSPDAEISRQDMMVIAARGMRMKKALDEGNAAEFLTRFADNGQIASYATADIAAMVREGIVKGNADGTVNPLGNTTRAEAAVIMDRIFTWAE